MTTETAPAGPQAVTGKEYQLLINGQDVAPEVRRDDGAPLSGEQRCHRRQVPEARPRRTWTRRSRRRERRSISGGWSKAPARQRATVLRKAADKIREEMNDLSRLLASEVGKPVSEAGMEVALTADVFEYYAGMAINDEGPGGVELHRRRDRA